MTGLKIGVALIAERLTAASSRSRTTERFVGRGARAFLCCWKALGPFTPAVIPYLLIISIIFE
jgi:hypothetical protein